MMSRTLKNEEIGEIGRKYEVEEVRDHAGKGSRTLLRIVRYDTIERLYRHTRAGKHWPLITLEQRDAANRLQADAALAATVPMARLTPGNPGRRPDFGIADAIIDANRRLAKAQASAGRYWPVTRAVAIEDTSLREVARLTHAKPADVKLALDRGLTALARHYGLIC